MKALTLTQPWATLVAIGAKQYETRSWRTAYRGPLAIHASKDFPVWARVISGEEPPFRKALREAGIPGWQSLPLGAIIATCELEHCVKITRDFEFPTGHEKSFGDFTLGRFAWGLSNVKLLRIPIPAKGALGLWEWHARDR